MNDCKIVLIGAVGMSPAVLTETVWALAQEDPPIIPDEVVVITTVDARVKLEDSLFGESAVWRALCTKLKGDKKKLCFGSSASIQVIGDGNSDFSDIITPEENDATADFILRVLRQYTEDPETRVIASIAGGRKTMSALMLACMSLVGREQDRVCHVLANDQYIFKNKDFYFPKTKAEEDAAQIHLSDIPFIRVRAWYEQEKGEAPASYSHMVSLFRKATPEAVILPEVELDRLAGTVQVAGELIAVSPQEFLLLLALVECFLKPGKAFEAWEDVAVEINDIMSEEFPYACGWHEKVMGSEYSKKRWSAVASSLRKGKLKGAAYASRLLPSPGDNMVYPDEKLTIIQTSLDV